MSQQVIVQFMRDTKLIEARQELQRLKIVAPQEDYRFLEMLLWAHEGNVSQALDLGQKLYSENPQDATLRFYLARMCIHLGLWKEGLSLFDSIRGQGPFGGPYLTNRKPLWNGEPLDGKTLFIASEGGLGDAVCFARFAKNFARLGARVVLGTYAPLFPLFENIPGVSALVELESHEKVHFDYWLPALSCPRLLNLDYADIDGGTYIHFPLQQRWQEITQTPKPKIGIIWQGNTGFAEDYLRSIPAQLLHPLFDLNELQFFSIHQDSDKNSTRHPNLVNLGSQISDPLELTSFLQCMDLIITVDTGPGHLAGALGVPTLLLNRKMGWFTFGHCPDPTAAQKTPWYESMLIFHQQIWGQWPETIERLKIHLQTHPVEKRKSRSAVYHPRSPQADLHSVKMVPTRLGPMLTLTNDYFVGKALLHYGEYSQGEVELFKRLIKPGDVVVEAGAHIGAHTICFAQLVGPQGKVLAFEPQPLLAQINRANLSLQQIENTQVRPQGLSSEFQCLQTTNWDYNQVGNFGAASLLINPLETQSLTVDLIPLDSLHLEKLDFIKMDIEGMEFLALLGAQKTILKQRPILYVEVDRPGEREKIEELLRSWNYQTHIHNPYLYNPNNFLKNPVNLYETGSSFNLLAIPLERPVDLQGTPRILK